MADKSNVIELPVKTCVDIPPERILDAAKNAGLSEVIVVGYGGDGALYMASSGAYGPDLVWMLERAKTHIMRSAVDDED